MKKAVLMGVYSLYCAVIAAQLRWDGEAGDGLWSTAANWVNDIMPGNGDEVLLDNTIVTGTYEVYLPAGDIAVSVMSLTISPADMSTITLVNPLSNTSVTAFTATATGDAIVLNKGAVFKNSSGAASGTPVIVSGSGFFRINNGGRYIHNTARGHTTGLVSRLSVAAGTEEGIFEFDVPSAGSYTISASNRLYGHLVFSAAAAGANKTYTASSSGPFSIRSNLEIGPNAFLSYGANTDIIDIGKDCIIRPGGTFNISNGPNDAIVSLKGNLRNEGLITETGSSTGSSFRFEGIATQDIFSTGNFSNSITTVINNAVGVTLLSALSIPFNLQLISGKIRTTATNLLSMNDNSVCTGGSAASFVEGPMKKTGNDDFDFPLGAGGIYAPIGIVGNEGADTDEFIAEYKRSNPQTTMGLDNNYESPIHHISYVEYWLLSQPAGTSSKTVRLFVSPASFAKEPGSLLAARFGAGQWNNEGAADWLPGIPSPPYITGSFTSSNPVGEWGAFAIASSEDESLNPLPVNLLVFDAVTTRPGTASLNWQLLEDPPANTMFQIEKAAADQRFYTTTTIPATGNNRFYQYEDKDMSTGINYYRLKIINTDSTVSFSRVVKLEHAARPLLVLQMSPTLVQHTAQVTVMADVSQPMTLLCIDMNGKLIMKKSLYCAAGTSSFTLSCEEIAAGLYQLVAISATGKTNVLRFVKR